MWLVIEKQEGLAALSIPLPEGETIVGRASDCAIVVADIEVSGHHLKVSRLGDTVSFKDLDSSIGTRLNDNLCDSAILKDGDCLRLHKTSITFTKKITQPKELSQDDTSEMAVVDWQPFKSFMDKLRRLSDPKELLERLLLGLVDLLNMERGYVLLTDKKGANPVAVASHQLADTEEFIAISATVYRKALNDGEPVYVLDTLKDSWYLGNSNQSLADSPRSIACTPLSSASTTFGVLYLDGAQGEAYIDKAHTTLFETMTGLASELLSAARTRSSLLAAKGRISALSTLTWDDGEQFVLGQGDYAKKLQELIDLAAAQDVSVMITGETGTGKEMVARALHKISPRREGPFVAVNCAALPSEIIEAELFGAEKGAFTGATERRIGRFEVASSGTLFLDEIGELPLDVQVKLLRSLQERKITRLGGSHPISVDFRLVCATNVDIEKAVQEGSFRQDFYYRVNVFRLGLEPLRNRKEDIEPLAKHFLEAFCIRFGRKLKGFTEKALHVITDYPWPGNIRELKNAIERAVVVERKEEVQATSLPVFIGDKLTASQNDAFLENLPREYEAAREIFERTFLKRSLEANNGNVTAVARETGMTRPAVYRRLQKLGISTKE